MPYTNRKSRRDTSRSRMRESRREKRRLYAGMSDAFSHVDYTSHSLIHVLELSRLANRAYPIRLQSWNLQLSTAQSNNSI
jgi:hypothetical protein